MGIKKKTLRRVSPIVVRSIWSSIHELKDKGLVCTRENITAEFHKQMGHNSSGQYNVPQLLKECCDDGLLVHHGGCYSMSDLERHEHNHDWYCFECHSEGEVVLCSGCHRVYHPRCYGEPLPDKLVCHSCRSCFKESRVDQALLNPQFENLLLWAYNKFDRLTTLPGSTFHLSQYRLLIAKHVDLSSMKSKVNSQQFANPWQFLADFQLLHHNVFILYGKGSPYEEQARQMLKQVEPEVRKMEADVASMHSAASVVGLCGLGPAAALYNPKHALPGPVHVDTKKSKSKKRSSDNSGAGEHSGTSSASPSKRKRKEKETDQAPIVSSSSEADSRRSVSVQVSFKDDSSMCNCECETKFRRLIMQLQQEWIDDYKAEKEKALVELADQLESDFNAKREKLKREMTENYRAELEKSIKEMDNQYAARIREENQKVLKKHKQQISETKKKQWCCVCEKESIYFCCWNTTYCSVECQQEHWSKHRTACKRKKEEKKKQASSGS